MRLRTTLCILFATLLSVTMTMAQQPATSSQALYKELQELQKKRMPTQTLSCAERLATQALREGNLYYTIEALEAHKTALRRLDYNRLL